MVDVYFESKEQHATEVFDYAVIAVGQFSHPKASHGVFPDCKLVAGDVLTRNDIRSLDVIANKEVHVVGFGKAAVSVISFTVQHDSNVGLGECVTIICLTVYEVDVSCLSS
jgi:hypothetical protein